MEPLLPGMLPQTGPLPQRTSNLPLVHFAYDCPVNAQWHVQPLSLSSLLSKKIVIPIFQRRYCWEISQTKKWFVDMLHAEAQLHGHGLGKALFAVNHTEGHLLCIDGQQRYAALLRYVFVFVNSSQSDDHNAANGKHTRYSAHATRKHR
jgi:hypothetical protein